MYTLKIRCDKELKKLQNLFRRPKKDSNGKGWSRESGTEAHECSRAHSPVISLIQLQSYWSSEQSWYGDGGGPRCRDAPIATARSTLSAALPDSTPVLFAPRLAAPAPGPSRVNFTSKLFLFSSIFRPCLVYPKTKFFSKFSVTSNFAVHIWSIKYR